MKRAAFLLCCSLAFPQVAHADEVPPKPFGERAKAVIAIDNLFGYVLSTYGRGHDEFTVSRFGTENGGIRFGWPETRIGVHWFVSPTVSFGAGLQWFHVGQGSDSSTLLGVAPRLGMVLPFGASSAVWMRVGGGYQRWDFGHDDTESHYMVGGELTYVHTSVSHFGWTFGPTFDVDVAVASGSGSGTKMEKHRTIGAAFGVLFDL